jgi:hypothetical protein
MYGTTTHRYGPANAGAARGRVAIAACVDTTVLVAGSWSIPSFSAMTAHKPGPRLLVTTS